MPSPVPASFRTVLSAVAAQLVTSTGVSRNRVLLVARQDTPRFQGDTDLLVRVGPPQPVAGFSSGAGRVAVVVRRALQVTARVRLALDLSDRDDSALTDAGGLVGVEEAVVDALHVWAPSDADANWLTQEPIHWQPGVAPVHETPVSNSWLHSDLVFDVLYQLPTTDNGF